MRLNTLGGLWIEGGEGAPPLAVRPRRLAILAILAAAGPKGASREQVLAVLWPESEPDRARHALSQTLYSLRQDLGGEAVIATPLELRLDPDRISSDVEDFRRAIAAREWTKAAALHRGPFLDGFFLAGATQFERWVEETRSQLEHEAMRALEATARDATAARHPDEAVAAWGRLTRLDPLSGKFAAAYMDALLLRDDRGAALTHGHEYVDLVRDELDAEPDAGVLERLEKLRGKGAPRRRSSEAAPADIPGPPPLPLPPRPVATPAPSSRRAPRSLLIPLVALLVVAAAAFAVTRLSSERTGGRASTPVIAVGRVQDLVTPDSAQIGGVLSEMLATSLGRLTSLQVIANSRILELIPRGGDTARNMRTEAARRAGATEVLEGELMPLPERQLHLALRRVDLDRGVVRRAYQVTGPDRLALFDSITVLIASDLELTAPTGSLAEVSTRSPLAYRLYEEGLRAFFQFDAFAANRLFHAAVREDSAFAMATYYAWRSEVATDGPRQAALADRAMSLASRAPERERLLILAHVGTSRSDLRAAGAAESLALRYPSDPEALTRAAEVSTELPRAVALLDRAIAIDSAAALAGTRVCRYCDALAALARRYDEADSTRAVERTFRRWISLRPDDYTPWQGLGDHLVGVGRISDAVQAIRRADSLGAPRANAEERRLTRSLRADDLIAADAICRERLDVLDRDEFLRYRTPCVTALRMQGRHRDALALLRNGRPPGSSVARRDIPRDPVLEAILELDVGRGRAAESDFTRQAEIAARDSTLPAGLAASRVAWRLTLAATAAAAVGDTIVARQLIDTVEAAGVRSLNPRDSRLHHFLRGLLLSRAGQHESAVRAFRDALYMPSRGFTRINLELGNSLIALGRAREAIPVLRATMHGGFDEPELYVTRTEMHEALARAFAAAGQRDSATAHYAFVERAWQRADSSFVDRFATARRWLGENARLAR